MVRDAGRRRVLVTGVAGRIGAAVCDRLARQAEIVGLDRRVSRWTTQLADLADPAIDLNAALEGVDAVLHVAALHAPHVGAEPDAAFRAVNVEATRRLAQAAAGRGVRDFVFTSTTALYGAGCVTGPGGRPAAAWVDEDTVPCPRTIYHHTKLAAEAVLAELAASLGLAVTVLRMSRCFPEAVPLMAAYRLHRGVDARDVAEAHAAALQTGIPGRSRCFVISGATPFEPHDAHALAQDAPAVLAVRAPALVEAFARRGWTLPVSIDRVYDARRAANGLGWRPRFGLDEVLRQADAGLPAN
jgi:nucleoside-diphosphate-sugar epimerase